MLVLPGTALADCASAVSSRGLTGTYRDQAIASCMQRGEELRAKLPSNPVVALQAAGALCSYSMAMAKIGNTNAPWDRSQASEIIDERAPAAVKAARANADLTKAVKEFYAAASAYCGNGDARSEQDYQLASKTLQLETKLAGIK